MSCRADKYIFPTAIAFLGGVLILAPLFIKAPSDYMTYTARNSVLQSEAVNRSRIEERKKTADIIRKTGLLPEGPTVRLIDYDDGDKRPRLKRQTLQHYLVDQTVFVYDRSSVCVGVIRNRKFSWKGEDKSACNNAPVISEDN